MSMDLLFDTPWWLPAALGIVAVVLVISGNNRQKKPLLYAGFGVFLLAVAWTGISYFVDTDLEKAVKRTHAIARAVHEKDWGKFQSLLDPRSSFAFYRGRDELVTHGRATAEKIGLKSVRVTGTETRQLDTLINVDIAVLSEQDITMNRPLPTNWRFTYQDLGNGWELMTVEPLPNQQITPDMITRELVRP